VFVYLATETMHHDIEGTERSEEVRK